MTRIPRPSATGISTTAKRSRFHNPSDRKVIDPFQVEISKVQDSDSEVVEDPLIRRALSAT